MVKSRALLGAFVLVVSTACVAEIDDQGAAPGATPDDPPAEDDPSVPAGDGPTAIACDDVGDEGSTWYDGPSASERYDGLFTGGPELAPTFLDSRVPQGLGTWTNWDGAGADLLVYTGYTDGGASWVQGVNPTTGAVTRVAHVPESHVGGVAIHAPWVFISGPSNTVDRYDLAALRDIFDGTTPVVDLEPVASIDVFGASFLTVEGDSLFAGRFNETARDAMVRYRIEASGTLTEVEGPIEVPQKTQGVAVTAGHYYFSTSYGRDKRSNLYVVERAPVANLDDARLSCFRAPSMSEGLTVHDDTVYVLYESGSFEYRSTARNAIAELHQAPEAALVGLMP